MKVMTSGQRRQEKNDPTPSRDRYLGVMPQFIPNVKIRSLSAINPIHSTFFILAEYASVALTVFICEHYWHSWLYFIAVMFIASRQHAIGNLAHDAAHFRLFANRRLNDWVGDYLLCRPLWLFLHPYRKGHFAHHRYFLSENDPHLPKTPLQPVPAHRLALRFLFNLSGIEGLRYLALLFLSMRKYRKIAFLLFWALIAFLACRGVYPVQLWLIYWLVPNFTWLMVASDIRFLAEHWVEDNIQLNDPYSVFYGSRIIVPNLFERIFVIRKNVNLHLDHHLYPSIPSYRLSKLHELLLEYPEYRERVHVTHGYFSGVLLEMLGKTSPPPRIQDLEAQRIKSSQHKLPLYSWTHSVSFFSGFPTKEEVTL